MSNTLSPPLGHILVLRQTDRWSSAIIRQLDDFQVDVRVFESPSVLTTQLTAFPSCVLVIELSEQLLNETSLLQMIWQQAKELDIPVFAAGDFKTQEFRLELIQVGFVEAFSCTSESERLLNLTVNCLKSRRIKPLSIENRVERDLPWASSPN